MRLFRRTMSDSKEIFFKFVRFMQCEMNKLNSKEFADFIGSRPLTKLKSAVKFFCKKPFKLREIWYNVGIENSVIMGCRNAFGRNKPTNKNGVCMYRGFGTERPYFKKDR